MQIQELPIQKMKPFLYFYKRKSCLSYPMLAGANVSLIPDGQHLPFTEAFFCRVTLASEGPRPGPGDARIAFQISPWPLPSS